MPGTINNEYGKVTISEDIIATVAGYAATENYGVVGMSAKTATDAILKLVGSEANKKRGVKVSFLGEGALHERFQYHQLTRAHKPERLVLGRSCVLVACITSSSTALLGLGSPSKQALWGL